MAKKLKAITTTKSTVKRRTYQVIWERTITAVSPKAAAEHALVYQQRNTRSGDERVLHVRRITLGPRPNKSRTYCMDPHVKKWTVILRYPTVKGRDEEYSVTWESGPAMDAFKASGIARRRMARNMDVPTKADDIAVAGVFEGHHMECIN